MCELIAQCETHCSVNKQRPASGMRTVRSHQNGNQKIPLITCWEKGIMLPGGNACWKREVFSPQSFLKLSTNVVCHCLLLMIGNMPYVGAKKTTQCSVKNHQPEFALGQTDATANISAPLGCFVTAASGYFGPPPFHNVNIVLDVQMQTLIAFLIISTTSNSSKVLSILSIYR